MRTFFIMGALALAASACAQPVAGANGAPGADGQPGSPGEAGENGSPGEPGQDGTSGERGADGAPGEAGPAGEQGAPGAMAGRDRIYVRTSTAVAPHTGDGPFEATANAACDEPADVLLSGGCSLPSSVTLEGLMAESAPHAEAEDVIAFYRCRFINADIGMEGASVELTARAVCLMGEP